MTGWLARVACIVVALTIVAALARQIEARLVSALEPHSIGHRARDGLLRCWLVQRNLLADKETIYSLGGARHGEFRTVYVHFRWPRERSVLEFFDEELRRWNLADEPARAMLGFFPGDALTGRLVGRLQTVSAMNLPSGRQVEAIWVFQLGGSAGYLVGVYTFDWNQSPYFPMLARSAEHSPGVLRLFRPRHDPNSGLLGTPGSEPIGTLRVDPMDRHWEFSYDAPHREVRVWLPPGGRPIPFEEISDLDAKLVEIGRELFPEAAISSQPARLFHPMPTSLPASEGPPGSKP